MGFHVEAGNGNNYFIRTENHLTTAVIGIIAPIDTTGRPSPPQPHNGFRTDYTPFGNGHVFALSLGGSDSDKNIVPQWEQWQQTGVWRRIETECEQDFKGKLFRCDVAYDTSLKDSYAETWDAFQNDRLIAWSDPRLPTSFRVRVYNPPAAAPGSQAEFDALLGTLDKSHPLRDFDTIDHRPMPREDVEYWQGQTIGTVLQDMHDDFMDAEEERVTGGGQKMERAISFTSFVLHPDTLPALQKSLEEYNGFSATDIAGMKRSVLLRSSHKMSDKKLKSEKVRHAQMYKTGGVRFKKSREDLTVARDLTPRERRALKNLKKAGII